MDLLVDLEARGLIQDSTDRDALAARLADAPITLYAGFDPTAESLHVGNLVPLLLVRRFQDAGHHPIVLAGGATGMIGDPSGRLGGERQLLDEDTLARNVAAVKAQLGQFVDLERATLVDNRDWTGDVRLLDFLRDVGKHATVNQMVAKESIRARMESEEGISYTEFSYMLLQAHDYLWLYEHHGCELQVGGSDQWGNITAGIDLVRRRVGAAVHGLTVPLITRADGSKLGKSEGENVWLDPARTSPYRMYQYFIGVDDRDVERLLLQLTLLPVEEARQVAAEHAAAPRKRAGQRRLAWEVSALVHGAQPADRAARASAVVFGQEDEGHLTPEVLADLAEDLPTSSVSVPAALVDLLAGSTLATSKSDARRGLQAGEVWLNGRSEPEDRTVTEADFRGGHALLRRGRKRHDILRLGG